jgi:NitT/TauT family transport system ATP-binding protein
MSETTPARAPDRAAPPLTVIGLRKTFDGGGGNPVEIIRSISFSLAKGEIVSIVGPSGCGKTTLLNMVCGLVAPSGGSVLWRGR